MHISWVRNHHIYIMQIGIPQKCSYNMITVIFLAVIQISTALIVTFLFAAISDKYIRSCQEIILVEMKLAKHVRFGSSGLSRANKVHPLATCLSVRLAYCFTLFSRSNTIRVSSAQCLQPLYFQSNLFDSHDEVLRGK